MNARACGLLGLKSSTLVRVLKCVTIWSLDVLCILSQGHTMSSIDACMFEPMAFQTASSTDVEFLKPLPFWQLRHAQDGWREQNYPLCAKLMFSRC